MPLPNGTRLGPYEVLSSLGAGGMGEVYKGRDTRLDRTVALKVLPAGLTGDENLRARFEREARAIAALSHPHICTIHDIGRHGEVDYLVMEYLDGETLADCLVRAGGPLPIEQTLEVGIHIADALDKAHRAGIFHRDLKPANIMLTRSGAKLLDFGLAKLRAPVTPVSMSGLTRATNPTTAEGTILGTIHYMSPEQVEGREADRRSDVWALGAVLYEAATGSRAFDGASAASIIGAILKDTPKPVSALQPLTPPSFDHVVERCLEKDPEDRWQDVGDVRHELQWIARNLARPEADKRSQADSRRSVATWIAAGLVVAALLAVAVVLRRPPPSAANAERMLLSIVPPDQVRFGGSLALSPDGSRLVFVGQGAEGPPSLWIRQLDSPAALQLPGTEDASYPFWSPRGDAVGFFGGGKLKTIVIAGGAPRTLASTPAARGGSWGADGTIIYVPEPNSPVYRVSDKGGAAIPVTALDRKRREVGHRWPMFIDARHFTFTAQGPPETTGIYLASMDRPETTRLAGAFSNAAFIDGHLLFVVDGMLVAQSIDVEGGRLLGNSVEVAGPVAFVAGLGLVAFSVSSNGALAYMAGGGEAASTRLEWFDRQGKPLGTLGSGTELATYNAYYQRLSPDGRMVAISEFRSATADLWLVDTNREVSTRFTFDDATEINPVWSPDGTQLMFTSNTTGIYDIFRQPVSGNGKQIALLKSDTQKYPTDWSSDGRTILFTNIDPKTQSDIWAISAAGDGKPEPLIVTPFNEYAARMSPDGHWIAYTSDESGRPEVYVQRLPSLTEKSQISTQGGSEPQWRSDGRELFYLALNRTLTSVPITTAPAFSAGRPAKIFDTIVDTTLGSFHAFHYSPAPDGQRFLVSVSALSPSSITVVLNWAARLRE